MRLATRALCIASRQLSTARHGRAPSSLSSTPSNPTTRPPPPSSSSSSSPPTTVVKLNRLVDWSGSHDHRRITGALANRHQMQRILRRLPLGHLDRHTYLNELPSNVKEDLVKAAYYKQNASAATAAAAPAVSSSRELVTLHGPRVTVSTAKIVAHRRHSEKQTRVDLLTEDDSINSNNKAKNEQGVRITEATLELPMMAHTSASLGLGWCATSGAVMVTTDNTAPRTQYAAVPTVYVLGIPEPLLPSPTTNDTAMHWLHRLLVFDVASQELLLRTSVPTTSSSDDARRVADHDRWRERIFLVQTFSFSPHAIHRAMSREAAQPPPSCRYRLFILTPAVMAAGDGNGTSQRVVQSCGARFPTAFKSYHVDIHTANPPRGGGDDGASAASWTPLKMKRLRRDGDDSQPDLWSAQLTGAKSHGTAASATLDTSSSSRSTEHAAGVGGPSHGSLSAGPSTRLTSVSAAEQLRELRRVFAHHHLDLLRRIEQRKGGAATNGTAATATVPRTTPLQESDSAVRAPGLASAAGVRRVRVSFAVAEYQHPNEAMPSSSPSSPCASAHAGDAATWLPAALDAALVHHRTHPLLPLSISTATTTTTGGTQTTHTDLTSASASPFASSLTPLCLATAHADLLFARERVLLPFLRRPRRDWMTPPTSTTRHARGSPWVWSVAELEAVTAWRTFFRPRYGPLTNLLTPELTVCLGARGSTSESTYGPQLILLHDATFIETVLLPAMTAYATLHYVTESQHGVARRRPDPDHPHSTSSLSWTSLSRGRVPGSEVLALLVTQPELAVAVHYKRLHGWTRTVFCAAPQHRDAWLHVENDAREDDGGEDDGGEDDGTEEEELEDVPPAAPSCSSSAARGSSEAALRRLPAAIRPLLQRAAQNPIPSPNQAQDPGDGAAGAVLASLRVVPVRPFLLWLAGGGEETTTAPTPDLVLTRDDERKATLYFAGWPEYFTMAGGVTTTVAFCVS